MIRRNARGIVAVAIATAVLFIGLSLREATQRDISRLVGRVGADLLFASHPRELSPEEIERMIDLPEVEAVAGQGAYTTILTPEDEYRITWLDVSTNFLDVLRLPLAEGRGFRPDDGDVAVLGWEVKEAIFGERSPVGEYLEGREIIGVLSPIPPDDIVREGHNRRVLTLSRLSLGRSGPDQEKSAGFRYFYIRISGPAERAERALLGLYPDLSIMSIATFYGFSFYDTSSLNHVMIVSAVGLLLMSGVLIAILLSLATLRRTHEIGIRRAVGASQAGILGLFLAEGGWIALTGGGIGIGLGLVVSVILVGGVALSPFHAAILPLVLIIGLIASTAPAIRASRLNPVEALAERSLFSRGRWSGVTTRGFVILAIAFAVGGLILVTNTLTASRRQIDSMWGEVDARTLLVRASKESILLKPELSLKDRDLIESSAEIELTVPFLYQRLPQGEGGKSMAVGAIGGGYPDLHLLEIVEGRDLSAEDLEEGRNVCVIADSYVKELGISDPVGRSVDISGQGFKVIGVFATSMTREEFPIDIVIPLAHQGLLPIGSWRFFARAREGSDLDRVKSQITEMFSARYPDRAKVSVLSIDAFRSKLAAFFNGAAARLGLTALVALLLAIAEGVTLVRFILDQRRHEFGVQRAVGAPPVRIIGAALKESSLLSTLGTALGSLLGSGLTPSVFNRLFLSEPPSLPSVVAASIAIALLISLVGAAPARTIVSRQPSELLRRGME